MTTKKVLGTVLGSTVKDGEIWYEMKLDDGSVVIARGDPSLDGQPPIARGHIMDVNVDAAQIVKSGA